MLALDRPIVDDHYDEIVFNEPPVNEAARVALAAGATAPQPPANPLLPVWDASEDLLRIRAARLKMAGDMAQLEERLSLRAEEASRMKEDLRALGLL